jgi:hypothetical protein
MRLRILAIAAVAVLTYYAIKHKAELPAAPDPTALIINMRSQVSPFRFTLDTGPEPPSCDAPITLRVHVIDAAGQPADGLMVEADASMSGMDQGAQHLALHSKGNGNYEGMMDLEMAGSWDVDLTATKGGKRGRQRLRIEVGGPHSRSADNDDTES